MATLALFPGSLHERPLHCNGLAQDVITCNERLLTMMIQNSQAVDKDIFSTSLIWAIRYTRTQK